MVIEKFGKISKKQVKTVSKVVELPKLKQKVSLKGSGESYNQKKVFRDN